MFRTIPVFPRAWIRIWARPLGTLAFYVHGEGRRTAFANLAAAFPGRYTEFEIEEIVRRCYQSWAQTYLDQFWTRGLTAENYHRFIDYNVADPEGFERMKSTGAICMMPHYGNFEWGAAGLSFLGIRYTAIAQDFKNPKLTGIFQKNRELLGHQIIPQETALLKLLRTLRRNGFVGFLPDLTCPPSQTATIIEVFGLKASVTLLGPVLIKRTGKPVLTGIILPMDDGTYYGTQFPIQHFPPEMTEQEIAQACWNACEAFISRRPEHWLWMYKHFRYRPAEGGDRYPPYANRSKKFDKLERTLAETAAS